MCLGQKGVQAFRQLIIEKEDFWLERSGGDAVVAGAKKGGSGYNKIIS